MATTGRRASYSEMKERKRHMMKSSHENTIFDNDPKLRLHAACLKNQKDLVERLLDEEGEDVNRRVSKDFTESRRRLTTPLIISARAGHASLVKFLLKRGANVNDASCNGASALYIACQELKTSNGGGGGVLRRGIERIL